MRIAVAILMAIVLVTIALRMLRSLGAGAPHEPSATLSLPPPDVRILFWCENCGTELLLVRQGSESPPRHCGEKMTRREEIARE